MTAAGFEGRCESRDAGTGCCCHFASRSSPVLREGWAPPAFGKARSGGRPGLFDGCREWVNWGSWILVQDEVSFGISWNPTVLSIEAIRLLVRLCSREFSYRW